MNDIMGAVRELPDIGFVMGLKSKSASFALAKDLTREHTLSNIMIESFVPQK